MKLCSSCNKRLPGFVFDHSRNSKCRLANAPQTTGTPASPRHILPCCPDSRISDLLRLPIPHHTNTILTCVTNILSFLELAQVLRVEDKSCVAIFQARLLDDDSPIKTVPIFQIIWTMITSVHSYYPGGWRCCSMSLVIIVAAVKKVLKGFDVASSISALSKRPVFVTACAHQMPPTRFDHGESFCWLSLLAR